MIRLARPAMLVCAVLFPLRAQAQDRVFDSNGILIHYIEQGQGEPIVLIHGNLGSAERWVRSGVLANLARDYRVIALDLRGFGKSGKPHDPKQYGRELGLDVVRLLDHLEINRAHIVGYSMGAAIAAHLLTSHPERVLTATLGGGAGWFTWTTADFDQADLEAAEWEQGRFGPARYATVLKSWPTDEPKPSEEYARQRMQAALDNPEFDRCAQAALRRSFRDLTYTPTQAAAVTVPTLGIAGSADPNLAILRQLKSVRPALNLVVIEGATHAGARGAMSRPEFVAAIRDFVRSQRRASTITRTSLEGVWRVVEVQFVRRDGDSIAFDAQPGLFIFTRSHYNSTWVSQREPRQSFASRFEPTREELAAACDALVVNSGTYEVSGDQLIVHPIVTRMPEFSGGRLIYRYRIDGNSLFLDAFDEYSRDGVQAPWARRQRILLKLLRAE
ncbi:MAG TPA: alpha/beta fold hydrolase [Longimicrobiales bacterium]|nr:alpha/beta fold hydrolase [Longimicrobiales bacterium]